MLLSSSCSRCGDALHTSDRGKAPRLEAFVMGLMRKLTI